MYFHIAYPNQILEASQSYKDVKDLSINAERIVGLLNRLAAN